MHFDIKQRSQLVKTIRLSTHIDICNEKRFPFFWDRGQKVKKNFWFNDVILPKEFIHNNEFVEKSLNGGVLTNFLWKSHILRILLTFEYFFSCTIEFFASRRFV